MSTGSPARDVRRGGRVPASPPRRDGPPAVRVAAAQIVVCSWALSGCVFFRSPTVPLGVEWDEPVPPAKARGLAVFLPGIFDGPNDFVEEGVVRELRRVEPSAGVALVDAHINYYKGKHHSIVRRLRQDVVQPACQRGYRRVWMMGNSLGGFGGLLYASRYPQEVSGVFAVSPYMGPDDIAEEVTAAGGLASWQPGNLDGMEGEDRFFREVWLSLKPNASADAARTPLFLGYGSDDDLAVPGGLIAETLPRAHVVVVPEGNHDWETWQPIFRTLFERARPLLTSSESAVECRTDLRGPTP